VIQHKSCSKVFHLKPLNHEIPLRQHALLERAQRLHSTLVPPTLTFPFLTSEPLPPTLVPSFSLFLPFCDRSLDTFTCLNAWRCASALPVVGVASFGTVGSAECPYTGSKGLGLFSLCGE